MNFGWRILLPFALLSIFLTSTLVFLFPNLF
jgi:NADH:ubiquinone oxidoreductase subunit H